MFIFIMFVGIFIQVYLVSELLFHSKLLYLFLNYCNIVVNCYAQCYLLYNKYCFLQHVIIISVNV